MTGGRAKCIIVGLGNRYRSDDGVGLAVVEELRKRELPPSVELIDGGMDELGLIEYFESADHVVIVDAVSTGELPGTLCTFLVNDTGLIPAVRNLGLHGFGLADAIALAAKLGPLPRITIVGIQPKSTAPREELSEIIRFRLLDLIEAVLRAVYRTPVCRAGHLSACDAQAGGTGRRTAVHA